MADKIDPKVWIASTPSDKDDLFEKLMRDGREDAWKREFMCDFTGAADTFAKMSSATAAAASSMKAFSGAMTSAAATATPKTMTADDLRKIAEAMKPLEAEKRRRGAYFDVDRFGDRIIKVDEEYRDDLIRPHLDYRAKAPKAKPVGEALHLDSSGISGPGFRFDATDGSLTVDASELKGTKGRPEPELRGHRRIAAALREKNEAMRDAALIQAATGEAPAKAEAQKDRGSEWGSW